MRWTSVFALALLGCSSGDLGSADPPVTETGIDDVAAVDTLVANDTAVASDAATDMGPEDAGPPAVRFIGRFDTSDTTAPRFAWSGSTMHARFTGTGLRVRLDGAANQFAVVIDGATPKTVKTTTGNNTYTLATGLSSGTHEVWLQRRTEAFFGEVRFRGFEFDGGELLPAPKTPGRRIEVIGDSISCGYGNEGKDQYCDFNADTENHYLTYAAIAARSLGADLHAIAWSGLGMYRNYDGATTGTIPERWGRTLPQQTTSTWDTSRFVPQAVVINLGTNDFARGDPGTNFVNAYVTFVKRVRAAYPDAWIFPAVGSMLSGTAHTSAKAHLNSVIAARAAEGDTKLSLIEFATQSAGDGYGCDWHPNLTTNEKMAKVLEAALEAKLGW